MAGIGGITQGTRLSFDYQSGNIVNQYNHTEIKANTSEFFKDWIKSETSIYSNKINNNNSVASLVYFVGDSIAFRFGCRVPKNSETLLCGFMFDNVVTLGVTNKAVYINNLSENIYYKEYNDSSEDMYLEVSINFSFGYNYKWNFSIFINDLKNGVYLLYDEPIVNYGSEDSEISLKLISDPDLVQGQNQQYALDTFYYGYNKKPTSIIRPSHLSVYANDTITLDGSESFDLEDSELTYLWNDGSIADYIEVQPQTTEQYTLQVKDSKGLTDTQTITVGVKSVEKIDTLHYKLSATLNAVDTFEYLWYSEDNLVNSTEHFVIVSPYKNQHYYCRVQDIYGNVEILDFYLEAQERFLNVKKNGIEQHIQIYPTTDYLENYVEIRKGSVGYLALGEDESENASFLHAKIHGIVYSVLLHA